MSATLTQALKERSAAEARIAHLLQKLWPIGNPIRWTRGADPSHWHEGIVTAHSTSDRIKVKNTATGREYWIHAYDVMETWR